MSEAATKETKEPTKDTTKAEGGEKKEKKVKEVKKVNVKSVKANATANIDPRTGTRFAPGSARQLGFDIVHKLAKEGKGVKEIREALANTRKEKGSPYNLDIGYLNFTVASHPEMFEVYDNGVVKIIKEPKIDHEAAKKFEEDREAKKKKAEAAREERKAKAKGEGEKKAEKSEGGEKKEKKADGDKPSKKEKAD